MSAKKKQNLNYARNVDVDVWHERQVCKRMKAQLEQWERDFIREHGGDTDEELRAYVLKKARQLGRMPHPLEISGGKFLQSRLGDWGELARSLGYSPVSPKKGEAAYRHIKEQTQEDYFRERRARRAEKKLEKIARDKEANLIQAAREKRGQQKNGPHDQGK